MVNHLLKCQNQSEFFFSEKTEVKLVEGEPEYILETGYEKLSIVLNCTSSSDPLTPVSPRWYSLRKKDHKELLVSDSEVKSNFHSVILFAHHAL